MAEATPARSAPPGSLGAQASTACARRAAREGSSIPRQVDAMRRQRVTREEIHAALREIGIEEPPTAAAVVLETDGSLSVIPCN